MEGVLAAWAWPHKCVYEMYSPGGEAHDTIWENDIPGIIQALKQPVPGGGPVYEYMDYMTIFGAPSGSGYSFWWVFAKERDREDTVNFEEGLVTGNLHYRFCPWHGKDGENNNYTYPHVGIWWQAMVIVEPDRDHISYDDDCQAWVRFEFYARTSYDHLYNAWAGFVHAWTWEEIKKIKEEDPLFQPSFVVTVHLSVEPSFRDWVRDVLWDPAWGARVYHIPLARAIQQDPELTDEIKVMRMGGEMNCLWPLGGEEYPHGQGTFPYWLGHGQDEGEAGLKKMFFGGAFSNDDPHNMDRLDKQILEMQVRALDQNPELVSYLDGYTYNLYVHTLPCINCENNHPPMPYDTFYTMMADIHAIHGPGGDYPGEVLITEMGVVADPRNPVEMANKATLVVHHYDVIERAREEIPNFPVVSGIYYAFDGGDWNLFLRLPNGDGEWCPTPAVYAYQLHAYTYNYNSPTMSYPNKPLACRDSLGTWSRGKRFLITRIFASCRGSALTFMMR
ncbi:MAG: hypothetical protein ABIN54_10770 [candidate division WOR-3 bacterium]